MRRTIAVLGLLAMALGLALAPTASTARVAAADASAARIRVIHASSNAPNVDVYVDGVKTLADVRYFTAGDYLDVPSGSHRVQVYAAGSPLTATPVISAALSFSPGAAYTIAATGLLGGSAGQAFGPTVLNDDLSTPMTGTARLRVYHFSPDAPAVGVRVKGGATLIDSLSFPNASAYLSVPAGTYNLEVFPVAAPSVVALTLNDVKLDAGNIYEAFAINQLASISISLNVISSRVRVIHASPDAPAVDVYVDDAKALSNVTFFTASNYLTLPIGAHRFRVVPAGQPPASAVLDATATLEAGRAYSVAAVGLAAGVTTQALTAQIFEDTISAPLPGKARVRVYHLSPDAPAVGVRVKGGPTLISSLSFPNASAALQVDPGVYTLEIFAAASPTSVVKTIDNIRLLPNLNYDVFATNRLASLAPVLLTRGPNDTPAFVVRLPIVTR